MTPSEVLPLRSALGLDPFAFAAILGVHVSSVYRWESTPRRRIPGAKRRRAEPPQLQRLQTDLLTALKAYLDKRPGIGPQLGKQISKALLGGGSLAGLRVLLDAITKEISHG